MYEASARARVGDVPYFGGLAPAELEFLVTAKDEDGRTLLHTAAANGHLQLLQLLANAGAGKVANKQDDEGWAPLHSAASAGYEAIVAALLSLGATADAVNSSGQTALHYAVRPPAPRDALQGPASKGHTGIVRLLLSAGSKVDPRDGTGSTPLHRAAATGRLEAARVLVEEGRARIDAHDKAGATPLLVAVACQQANAAVYLASRGASLAAANKNGETPLALAGALAPALQQAAGGGGGADMEM
ncbi:hypothetical protein MNEG_12872 [Monoraphidium neglectum]|uniref:Uncharacterized protein n=1 Tax=Monoraphidium neglectum TaxID=145388 RepID=A0A0D2MJD1_9CHLO|nr:hypothetical protein MNEG_12872 [Monoraphidium neglectum]KIY95090.1 hypothetical protein MNEG_12872 [Monoraphidium neglectum]|eukprot:XP_013894110.1 hypothetical protein MNEG_12872 [Monoraphidium neglectum]